MTIYLTKLGDLSFYPPILSLIRVLRDLDYNVVYIGAYSDEQQKSSLIKSGVRFINTVNYLPEYNPAIKVFRLIQYKKQVEQALTADQASSMDILWIINSDTISILSQLVPRYRTVLHFLEFTEAKFNYKYLLVNLGRSFKGALAHAKAIIQCEYNRAQIFKGLYKLDALPFVLPNKPYFEDTVFQDIPSDVQSIVSRIKAVCNDKKVILYQGYFNSSQRRLDEFCSAIMQMSDDYRMIVMGRGNSSFEKLRKSYSSNKIIFIPFINPPYHLLITQLAHIGILSYFPTGRNITEVINPLYCAPNKIFEYGKYGIPMISNDIPGLRYIFNEYKSGLCIDYPMTAERIKEAIERVFDSYELFSKGSRDYYDSVDIKEIVSSVLRQLEK